MKKSYVQSPEQGTGPRFVSFNLMFSTEMGSTADGALKIYLRPETAQGIFC